MFTWTSTRIGTKPSILFSPGFEMSPERVFDLTVNASLENLQVVRQYIEQASSRLGVCPEVLGDLLLVIDEAVTNVIIHGYDDSEGVVKLHMETEGNSVIISIRDQAKDFDASIVNAPKLDTALKDRPFGGMGIFLIRKMTDEAEFLSLPGGGNELRLVKHGAIQPNT
jgi:serine/threonine-protein kinase RsbW